MRHIVVTAKTKIAPFIQHYWILGATVLVCGGFIGSAFWNAYKNLPSEAQQKTRYEANRIFFQKLGNKFADYADFKKVCETSGGENTWNPLWPSATLTTGILPVSCYTGNPEKLAEAFPSRVEIRKIPRGE